MRRPYGPMQEKKRSVGATHALPCSASGGKSDRRLAPIGDFFAHAVSAPGAPREGGMRSLHPSFARV